MTHPVASFNIRDTNILAVIVLEDKWQVWDHVLVSSPLFFLAVGGAVDKQSGLFRKLPCDKLKAVAFMQTD